jgi:hypothetical protein
MREKTKGTFKLVLDAAATPARVAAVADLIGSLMQAGGEGVADDDVTLEIRNYELKAEVRQRTDEAVRAAKAVTGFLRDPVGAARKNPRARELTHALGAVERLRPHKLTLHVPRRRDVLIDDTLLSAARGAVESPQRRYTGTDQIYSPVLRVGSREAGEPMRARVVAYGQPVDLLFDASCADDLFKLLRTQQEGRIDLAEVSWVLGTDGGPDAVDFRRSRITGVMPMDPLSFDDLHDLVRAAAEKDGPLFERPLDEILREVRSEA